MKIKSGFRNSKQWVTQFGTFLFLKRSINLQFCVIKHKQVDDQRIIVLLEEISKDLKKVHLSIEEMNQAEINDPRNWVNPQDAIKILGVSVRTLYSLRVNNDVKWKLLGKQHRYFVRSLHEIRKYHLK